QARAAIRAILSLRSDVPSDVARMRRRTHTQHPDGTLLLRIRGERPRRRAPQERRASSSAQPPTARTRKGDTAFRQRSCSNNTVERDGDSKKSHLALGHETARL